MRLTNKKNHVTGWMDVKVVFRIAYSNQRQVTLICTKSTAQVQFKSQDNFEIFSLFSGNPWSGAVRQNVSLRLKRLRHLAAVLVKVWRKLIWDVWRTRPTKTVKQNQTFSSLQGLCFKTVPNTSLRETDFSEISKSTLALN